VKLRRVKLTIQHKGNKYVKNFFFLFIIFVFGSFSHCAIFDLLGRVGGRNFLIILFGAFFENAKLQLEFFKISFFLKKRRLID
jgi:hypothetical protein